MSNDPNVLDPLARLTDSVRRLIDVTVSIDAMNFRKPVYVGDLVSVHANLVRVGRTSITVHLEAWVLRRKEMQPILVTDGNFTYVSIDEQGHPQVIPRDGMPIAT